MGTGKTLRIWVWMTLIGVLLAVGCGRKVEVMTSSTGMDVMQGKMTYTWLQPDRGDEKGGRVYNPEVDAVVKKTVDERLSKLGYRLLDDRSGGDFQVSWFGGIDTRLKVESINHFYANHGYGSLARAMPEKVAEAGSVREYEQGTIAIYILDPASQQVIWRGKGGDRLRKGMDRQDAGLYITKIVNAILEDFPPAKP